MKQFYGNLHLLYPFQGILLNKVKCFFIKLKMKICKRLSERLYDASQHFREQQHKHKTNLSINGGV
jgi:hypothetical protein